ncbi:ATPase, V1/A1 complex, subunit E [Pelagophyceae sp. CCMP2097]|nr:ATPase, V1/A1 complex, subunit E [Pelagophyceae sp. CCMP2097]
MESKNQIRQMVNFILQEAHEKANEIRIKTEHDFNIEKQLLVHNAKLAIAEEYKGKARAREVEDRIARSSALGDARIAKMKVRDSLLQKLVATAKVHTASIRTTAAYPLLIKNLIIQGLIKIEEKDVTIFCRQSDVQVCQQQIAAASAEYKAIVYKATGQKVESVVTVNVIAAKMIPDEECCGGIRLAACHGRIICDNSLDARVNLVYDEVLPTIRGKLWPDPNPMPPRVHVKKAQHNH